VNKKGEYLPSDVGRCDREIKCAYHYKAGDYFKDKNIDLNSVKTEVINRATEYYKIDNWYLSSYRRCLEQFQDLASCENNFVRYLIDTLNFSSEVVKAEMLKYNVFINQNKGRYTSTDLPVPGAYDDYINNLNRSNQQVRYFYVSANQEIRTAREIIYKTDFHRDKESGLLIHHLYDDFSSKKRVKWCIFGEHLLTDFSDKRDIIIVEAEKTALVMSLYYPEFLWLSVGGLNGISQDFDYCRNDVVNYFIPDSDIDIKGVSCADKWRKKIPYTIYFQTPYKVVDFHKFCNPDEIEEGFDILDLQLKDPGRAKRLIDSLSYFMA
jgi:hypothetical protein